MPVSLSCACGARLEVDDVFAGKTVQCPDCTLPLQVPRLESPLLRTSGLALTSLVLSLAGAFTLVGSLAGVVVGILALVFMRGKEERLSGKGLAIAGITFGVLFTALTVFALTSELFGARRLLREAQWAGKLDYSGPEEIERKDEGFAISRPSKAWGEYVEGSASGKKSDGGIRTWDDLLLVHPGHDAHLLVFPKRSTQAQSFESCRRDALKEFKTKDKFGIFGRKGIDREPQKFEDSPPKEELVGSIESYEIQIKKIYAGQDRTFLMRVVRKQNTDVWYIVLAGARTKNFAALEPELRKGLESFRLID